MSPFEPAIRAATNAVEARLDQIQAAKATQPDDWQALRLRTFWNGHSAIALAKPRHIKPLNVSISVNGELQEYSGGKGVLAVLLRVPSDQLVVDCTVDGAAVQEEISITDL